MQDKYHFRKILAAISVLLLIVFAQACHRAYYPVSYHYAKTTISDSIPAEAHAYELILPYKTKLEKEMNSVIGIAARQLTKGKPESTLGNFLAELLLEQASKHYGNPVDAAILNYGGIRIPSLPEGEITRGNIFELMPFDNFLVVMQLDSATIHQLADAMAKDGGWPIAGMRYRIMEGKAIDITVKGQPLSRDKTYTIAISDYLANGGDNLSFLKGKPYDNLGIFVRDAIIQYIQDKHRNGEKIDASLDGRVVYATQ